MEYRKLTPGTKLRFVGDVDEYTFPAVGDVLVVVEDDGSSLPYLAKVERDGYEEWFFASDVELIEDVPSAFKSKTIMLVSVNGEEFSMSVGSTDRSVFIAVGGDGISVSLDAFLAAAREFEKEAR